MTERNRKSGENTPGDVSAGDLRSPVNTGRKQVPKG